MARYASKNATRTATKTSRAAKSTTTRATRFAKSTTAKPAARTAKSPTGATPRVNKAKGKAVKAPASSRRTPPAGYRSMPRR